MDFKQLESFVEVVRTGSFTRAGEKLFLSQPTVSTHVKQLEDELGIRLVRRTTKTLELTPKGEEMYEYAASILDMRKRILRLAEEEETRVIHLGVSTIPSAYILPEVLPEFIRLHPDVRVEITQSDSQGILDRIRDGVFDVGLVGMRTEDEALVFRPFCRDHMVFIAPNTPFYRGLKEKGASGAEELLRQPIILREKGSGSKKMADHYLEAAGASEESLNIIARINDQETIKQLVAEGLGISIVSERSARDYLEIGKLLSFEIGDYHAERYLYLVNRRNAPISAAEREFMQFVTGRFAVETKNEGK